MRILIVGAGTVGFGLAQELSDENHDVWLVDSQKKVLNRHEAENYSTIHGNIFLSKVQKNIDIASMNMVIAVTESDATNILVCEIAKELNVPIKIARTKNPDFELDGYPLSCVNLGVDKIINTDQLTIITLDRLVRVASSTSVTTFKDSDIVLRGFFVPEDSKFVNNTIAKIGAGISDYSFLILAISREQKMIIPRGDVVINAGDEIFVLMQKDIVEFFLPLLYKKVKKIKHVLIFGASKIGIGLAKILSNSIPRIFIVDSDIEKCELASNEATKATVVCSDITSEEFQDELDLDTVDVFVATSNNDEKNFIASLMMKNKMSKHSRTLVVSNREEYDSLIPKVGLGESINPRLIAVSEILSHISKEDVLSIAKFNYGDAEAFEIVIPEKSAALKKTLKDLKIPLDAIVGTVTRDDEVIIPNGATVFQPNDKVILFTINNSRLKAQEIFESKKKWYAK
ncbi:MAG: Trk system potassium transporter TrkA [Planctomycetota bacterium]|nr:MAG: Trk system potassium transporter TrkA [Planctomycetota bacterium]